MRNIAIGLIIGAVLGIVFGATTIAPRLQRTPPGQTPAPAPAVQAPADIAEQLPRALAPRPAVSLKMASAFPPDMPVAGELGKRIDRRVWEVSRGQLEISTYPPGALAPVADLYEAVGSGAVDAALASPLIASHLLPAMQIYAGLPFGPPPDEFLSWLEFGGGRELLDRMNAERNVHGIPCGMLPPSAFGWFRHELHTPQDLRGLRINASGLAARVLQRLGAEVVSLPMGELMLAVEQGSVDAVVHGSPAIDRATPFGTWLKNYYPHGWSQSLTMLELLINRRVWRQLNGTQQAQIETVCGDNVRYSLAEGEALQFEALKDMVAAGVRVQRLPPGVREALQAAWQQVVPQASAEDADFRRVWESLSAFRSDFAVWRELSRP